MKMPTIIQRGRFVLMPIAAVVVSLVSCRTYDLTRLDLDAAIAQPTLVTPSDQTEGFRAVGWLSRPIERNRLGYLESNDYRAGFPPNTLWRLPEVQGGGYIEVELPSMTFFGMGGQVSTRNGKISELFECRIGIKEQGSLTMTRTSLGFFVGRLRADAFYVLRSNISNESWGTAEVSGLQTTRGYFADGIISATPSKERVIPFFGVTFVRQDLYTFKVDNNSSGGPINEIQIMYMYSVTPGVDIPLSNGTTLTVALRLISDISISETKPGIFLVPQVQWSADF